MLTTAAKKAFWAKVGYEPHGKQWLFHNSQARFRVACCGRRFGKSTMSAMEEAPGMMLPDKRGWIVGPTYDLAEKEFRVIWNTYILKLGFGRNKRVKKAYNKKQGDMYIEFPWQTRIECRSADHPENLVGEALDWVIMSEAAKHKNDTWERYVQPALTDKRGHATFPTTPEGYNWLYHMWALGRNPEEPLYESWQFPSWENRIVFPDGRQDEEILRVERNTADEWFKQEYGADFSAFVGKIYAEFQENIHVRQVRFNPAWPSYVAYDPGYTNPFAWVFFQVDPQDNIYVWREHYKSYMQLAEHIAFIRNMEKPAGYHLDMAFGDAADPEAAMSISENLVYAWAEPEAKKNWREGVDLLKSFLKLQDVYSPGGGLVVADEYGTPLQKPRIFIDHSCTNTIREFNNYRAPDTRPGVNVREAAQKYDDHALDALRYGLMHIFKLGAASKLSDIYAQSDFAIKSGAMGLSGFDFGAGGSFFNMKDLEF
jgi:hypothetical protein